MKEIRIEDIQGFAFGQAEDEENGTGCTVILCEKGGTAGVDVRGGGPATRDTDLLRPENTVEKVNAIVLGGGSAYGLEAASGVMKYLSGKKAGFQVGDIFVPIVVQADIFDLAVAAPVWPNAKMGYEAAVNAEKNVLLEGNHGAGTGASVGKMLGMEYAMKSGLGAYALENGPLQVGAVAAVNACADVYMPDSNEVLASIYDRSLKKHLSTSQLLLDLAENQSQAGANTTIGCIVTNAKLSKAQMNKLASMCHDAYARCIRPCHMTTDGDTIFAISSEEAETQLDIVAVMAQECMVKAIENAVKKADEAYGLVSWKSLNR